MLGECLGKRLREELPQWWGEMLVEKQCERMGKRLVKCFNFSQLSSPDEGLVYLMVVKTVTIYKQIPQFHFHQLVFITLCSSAHSHLTSANSIPAIMSPFSLMLQVLI